MPVAFILLINFMFQTYIKVSGPRVKTFYIEKDSYMDAI